VTRKNREEFAANESEEQSVFFTFFFLTQNIYFAFFRVQNISIEGTINGCGKNYEFFQLEELLFNYICNEGSTVLISLAHVRSSVAR